MGRAFLLLVVLLTATPASAQVKLAGTFALDGCSERPGWASFAMLPDWADFNEAADCSRRTGIRWVLALYGVSLNAPPLALYHHALAVKARADAAGLRVLAVVPNEEHYEHAFTPGAFPLAGLDPASPADTLAIVHEVQARASLTYWIVGVVFPGVPRMWITGLFNNNPAYGPALYRPLPSGVDVLAIEAYQPAGWTWAQTGGLYVGHALATSPVPVVVIGQGFVHPGDPLWGAGPTEDAVDGFAAALRHPKVIAGMVFDWKDRANGLRGLVSLPYWRGRFETALGVRF